MVLLYFFFFDDNFNVQENSNSIDLDLFFLDDNKIIHLATAGMSLHNLNLEINPFTYSLNMREVLSYRRIFAYDINNSIERNNLTSLSDYTAFFELMAKRGFYSYDKVNIDDKEDYTFQLITKPKFDCKIIIDSSVELGNLDSSRSIEYNLDFLKSKTVFPEDYSEFDLRNFI